MLKRLSHEMDLAFRETVPLMLKLLPPPCPSFWHIWRWDPRPLSSWWPPCPRLHPRRRRGWAGCLQSKEYSSGRTTIFWSSSLLFPPKKLCPRGECLPQSKSFSAMIFFLSTALKGKFHLCIPFLGIVRPQSQFPHSCVVEPFIYSQDRSTYFTAAE